jgi:hypothetical protein
VAMKRVLLTGMSGTGKDWVWREDRIQELLSSDDVEVLFLSGCSPNQGKFYPQFDHIVLLTAPPAVLVERLPPGPPIPTASTPMRSLGSLPCSKRSNRCCEVARDWSWTPALPSTRSSPPFSGSCSHPHRQHHQGDCLKGHAAADGDQPQRPGKHDPGPAGQLHRWSLAR